MCSRSLTRFVAGYGAILCALPYLGLKVIWITGGQLGVANAELMRHPSMVALNVATAFMDLVGVGTALAFTHAWGQRVPAWLLVPPIWVGTGLLCRFVAAVPLIMLGGVLASASAPLPTGGPVHAWVYVLVYLEFVGLGIGLATAFVLYAQVRWPWSFRPMMGSPPSAMRSLLVPLSTAAALMAACAGSVHLAWSLGANVGLPNTTGRPLAAHLLNAVDGSLMLAGAAGILALVHEGGRRARPWVPLALAWIGSGFLFGWGLWGLINVLGNTPLVQQRAIAMPFLNLMNLVQLIAGLVIGLIVLVVLCEQQAAWARGMAIDTTSAAVES